MTTAGQSPATRGAGSSNASQVMASISPQRSHTMQSITIIPVLLLPGDRPGYKATLVTSTGKEYNWCVRKNEFPLIETQALSYEEFEIARGAK